MARNVPVALESLGGIVAPGISQRIALAECVMDHQWIGEFAPGSAAHEEFIRLAAFLKKLET